MSKRATNEIELHLRGCMLTTQPPLGIQKPGVVHISNRTIIFDEFVIGVSSNNQEGMMTAMNCLLHWARFRLSAQLPSTGPEEGWKTQEGK